MVPTHDVPPGGVGKPGRGRGQKEAGDTGAETGEPGQVFNFLPQRGAAYLITIQVEVKDVHSKGIIKSKRWN